MVPKCMSMTFMSSDCEFEYLVEECSSSFGVTVAPSAVLGGN